MRDIKVNGEVRTVYTEDTWFFFVNGIFCNTITLLFDFGSLLIQLDGPALHKNDIQELIDAPLKPGNLWERSAGMVKLNCGEEFPVTYCLTGLEACHKTIIDLEKTKECELKSAKDRYLTDRKAHDLALERVEAKKARLQAKAQAIKQPTTAPEPRKPIEPSIKPKFLVTFSEEFKTVTCTAWNKSESRARGRQANVILRKLFKNWRDKHNRPMPVEELIKDQKAEGLRKALNATKYPKAWTLIVTHPEGKSGKRIAMLSDIYEYQES